MSIPITDRAQKVMVEAAAIVMDEITRLRSENKRLRDALEPFAAHAGLFGQDDKPSALLRMAMRLYNRGYRSGHHSTVEGGYADIFACDMENYHEDEAREIVQDFLGSNLTDADLKDIQTIFDDAPLPICPRT
jgi:hypothetical protein